jgi:hypothetical protein
LFGGGGICNPQMLDQRSSVADKFRTSPSVQQFSFQFAAKSMEWFTDQTSFSHNMHLHEKQQE